MSRRLQILVDEPRWRRLEAEATRRRCSVASVVRDAIDEALADDDIAIRRKAAETLLGADPMPVDEWEVMKREIVDLDVTGA